MTKCPEKITPLAADQAEADRDAAEAAQDAVDAEKDAALKRGTEAELRTNRENRRNYENDISSGEQDAVSPCLSSPATNPEPANPDRACFPVGWRGYQAAEKPTQGGGV